MDHPRRDTTQMGYGTTNNNFQLRNGYVDKAFHHRQCRRTNSKAARKDEELQRMKAAIHANEEDPVANAYFLKRYGFPGIPRRFEGTVVRRRDGTLPPPRKLPYFERQAAANKNNRPYAERVVTLWGEDDFPPLPSAPAPRQQVTAKKGGNCVVTTANEKIEITQTVEEIDVSAAEESPTADTLEDNSVSHLAEREANTIGAELVDGLMGVRLE